MDYYFISDIEAQIRDIQSKKKEISSEALNDKGVGLLESGYFDSDIYDEGGGQKSRYENYVTSIAPNEDDDDEDEGMPTSGSQNKRAGYTAPAALLNDVAQVIKNLKVFFFISSKSFIFPIFSIE
jgi:splicing factor 3B subunit 1